VSTTLRLDTAFGAADPVQLHHHRSLRLTARQVVPCARRRRGCGAPAARIGYRSACGSLKLWQARARGPHARSRPSPWEWPAGDTQGGGRPLLRRAAPCSRLKVAPAWR
jgi:hypothetical protein